MKRLHLLSEGQIKGRWVVVNPDFIVPVEDVFYSSAEYKNN